MCVLCGRPLATPFCPHCGLDAAGHFAPVVLSPELADLEKRVNPGAALNAGAVIQTHLFEDRVMKSSFLKIGEESSIGNMAVILYDAEMQSGSSLGPLSLLMKGETLSRSGRWHGCPTVQVEGVSCP